METRKNRLFTERELQVMKALWKLKRACVRDIQMEIGPRKAGGYTTIASILRILESQGVISHEKDGRSYYYIPNLSREEEQARALQFLVRGFFDGNAVTVLKTLLSEYDLEKET